MKKVLSALTLAVSASLATASPVITSGTLTVNGFEHSGAPAATVLGYGVPVSLGVGALRVTFDDGFSPEDLLAFCVDLFSPAGIGASYSYDRVDYTPADFPSALEPENITALSKLFTFNGGVSSADNVKSAGLQLAVWELLYDGEGGSLSTGDFKSGSTPAAVVSWANGLLAGATSSSTDYNISLFADEAYSFKPNHQNFITATFNSGGSCELGNDCTVPEPTSMSLAAFGMFAVGVMKLRRRKTNA